MQKKKEAASEELYGELGQALNFTRGDLEANRAGFINHRQIHEHTRKLLRNIIKMSAALIAIIVIIGLSFEGKWIIGGWELIVCLSLPITCLSLLILFSIASIYDLRARISDSVSGWVSVRAEHGARGSTLYYLRCSEREFIVSKELYEFNWKQGTHILYYKSNQILSVEHLLSMYRN